MEKCSFDLDCSGEDFSRQDTSIKVFISDKRHSATTSRSPQISGHKRCGLCLISNRAAS